MKIKTKEKLKKTDLTPPMPEPDLEIVKSSSSQHRFLDKNKHARK
jgi:hypothetical protein